MLPQEVMERVRDESGRLLGNILPVLVRKALQTGLAPRILERRRSIPGIVLLSRFQDRALSETIRQIKMVMKDASEGSGTTDDECLAFIREISEAVRACKSPMHGDGLMLDPRIKKPEKDGIFRAKARATLR